MSENGDDKVEMGQPSPLRTKLTLLCLVAVELLLIAIIVFLFYSTQSCPDISEDKVCTNPECLHTAAHILNSIDFTQEPCENFYDYACGNMDLAYHEQLDIFSPNVLMGKDEPQFQKKFRSFYQSCVNHEDKFDYETRIEKTKTLLNRVGFVRLSNRENVDFNLTKFVAEMILYDSMPLFDVGVDDTSEDSTFILKLLLPDQTSIHMGHWSSLSETKRKCMRQTESMSYRKKLNTTILYDSFLLCQKDYGDYLDSISTTIRELNIFTNMTQNEIYGRIRDIRMFIEFEILSKFDEIPLPPNLQELNIKHNFINVKVGELEKRFPLIQWEVLFEILTNKNITSETVIQLYNEEYFIDVFEQLSGEKHKNLNNAFLALLANNLFVNTVLPSHKHSREQYCKDQSRELMPDIVNYLYKRMANQELIKEKNEAIRKLFHELKGRFSISLKEQYWLDDETRLSITKKLESIELVSFHNDDIDSERRYLEAVYESLDMRIDSYQQNHFDLVKYRRRHVFALHGENITSENIYRYFIDVTQEDPIFFYTNNHIYVPYGFLKNIKENLPSYLIESRVGFALAKMLGHAFDNIGIHHDVNLIRRSKSVYNKFAEQTRDMLLLLNPIIFDGKLLYFNLNNDLSESDRIADNTAMRIVTNYFSEILDFELLPGLPSNFTKEKLIFSHLVQGFCKKMRVTDFIIQAFESPILPPQMRVANFLGNSEEFLRTFSCKPSSGMARIRDSLQFPYLS